MLKFAGVADIGDIIRAYDFKPCAGRGDAYVEGEVEAITNECGFKAYKIKVSADKFIGDVETIKTENNRIGQYIFAPFETSFMDFDFRIVNLSKV
jgi:hypothetical protein